MPWLRGLARDPGLAADFQWEPIRKFKCKYGEEEPFFDEPMTANDCHDIQVLYNNSAMFTANICCSMASLQDKLPQGTYAMNLSIYADATQIARFAGKSFHPVIGRVLNISDAKRNISEHGGGTLLGYIPKVDLLHLMKTFLLEQFYSRLTYLLKVIREPRHSLISNEMSTTVPWIASLLLLLLPLKWVRPQSVVMVLPGSGIPGFLYYLLTMRSSTYYAPS